MGGRSSGGASTGPPFPRLRDPTLGVHGQAKVDEPEGGTLAKLRTVMLSPIHQDVVTVHVLRIGSDTEKSRSFEVGAAQEESGQKTNSPEAAIKHYTSYNRPN